MFGIWPNLGRQPAIGAGGAIGPFRDGSPPLSDAEIRAALAAVGFGPSDELSVVLEEVECRRGYVRADYVCLSADMLSIVEIKSDRDSLRRLDEQIRIYSAVADRVTLVVGWSLAAHALRATPSWWDVILAERDPKLDIRFVPLRDGGQNPGVTAEALVAMLPIGDVRRLPCAAEKSLGRLRGQALHQAVAGYLSRDEILTAIREWLGRLSQRRNHDRAVPASMRTAPGA
jgi:hypothetical protein